MIVKEFIKKLKTLDQNKEIVMAVDEKGNYYAELEEIESANNIGFERDCYLLYPGAYIETQEK